MRPLPVDRLKFCTLCKVGKPLSAYNKLSHCKGGATHYARCKQCRNALEVAKSKHIRDEAVANSNRAFNDFLVSMPVGSLSGSVR